MSQQPPFYDPNDPHASQQPPFDPNNPYGSQQPLFYDPNNPQASQQPPFYDPNNPHASQYPPFYDPNNPYGYTNYQQPPQYGFTNQQQTYPQANEFNDAYAMQLPNAGTILTLGILSIVFCTFGGAIMGGIAMSMASTAKAMFEQHPGQYSRASLRKVETGRTCAIAGIILFFVLTLILIVIFGMAKRNEPYADPYDTYGM